VRYAIWILFAGALLAYVLVVQPRAPEPRRYAARALPANHRMAPADLVDWPRLAPQRGRLAVAFPAANGVGDEAWLCLAPPTKPQRVRVAALLCDRGGGECIGIAALSLGQAQAVVASEQAGAAARLAASCG
jgi:hypothetical protein